LVGCCGEDEGPDRVFNFYFEILFAKLEDLVVISFSLRILYVNIVHCHTNAVSNPFGAFPVQKEKIYLLERED
jgi:hypothetical protein